MPALRPPPDLTAADFFERWLGEAYRSQGLRTPADAPVVRVTLGGDGGGEWEISSDGDDLRVERREPVARAPRPGTVEGRVWIRQNTADFLATFAKDPDLPELLPRHFGPLDMLFLDPQDVEMIRQIDGRLAVELTGHRRRRWALDLAAGKTGLAAGRPRSTVRLDAATYEGLRDGSMPPLKALMERKINIDGDRALAMQTLLLLGSRLARS